MSGRSIPSSIENRHKIREVIWPSLLGVGKRDVGTIEKTNNELIEKKFKELEIDQEAVPVAILFCQSRGIEISDPLGDWIYLFRPISQLSIPLSSQYRILHPISTRLTPHAPKSLKSACDVILLLLQYHEPNISQKLSDLRLDVLKGTGSDRNIVFFIFNLCCLSPSKLFRLFYHLYLHVVSRQ